MKAYQAGTFTSWAKTKYITAIWPLVRFLSLPFSFHRTAVSSFWLSQLSTPYLYPIEGIRIWCLPQMDPITNWKIWKSFFFHLSICRREEAEQLKAANNSLRLELERFQGLETQLQVQLILHHNHRHHHHHHQRHHHPRAQVQKQRAEELGLVVAMKNDQLRQVKEIKTVFHLSLIISFWIFVKINQLHHVKEISKNRFIFGRL